MEASSVALACFLVKPFRAKNVTAGTLAVWALLGRAQSSSHPGLVTVPARKMC